MPHDSFRAAAALSIALIAGNGCSTQGPNLPACTGPVTVTATSGTSPTFSWTPACQLEGLTVALPGPGAIVWSVASPNQTNSIAPSVRYGRTPAGATLVTGATALSAGSSYGVTLFVFDDGHGGSVQAAGSLTFVP